MLTLHVIPDTVDPSAAFTERLKRALYPLEVQSYMGRGMFGRICVGVWSEWRTALVRLVESNEFSQYELVSLINDMRYDSPVCYWPMREWADHDFDQITDIARGYGCEKLCATGTEDCRCRHFFDRNEE